MKGKFQRTASDRKARSFGAAPLRQAAVLSRKSPGPREAAPAELGREKRSKMTQATDEANASSAVEI